MKIFITRPIPESGIKLLRDKGYEVLINEAAKDRAADKQEILAGIKGTDALLSVLTEKIDAEIMDTGLPTLKIIANYAVGFDNIDLDAAKQRNLMVTNTPDVLTNTVAEHTFALMLAISHRIAEADKFIRAGMYSVWGPMLLLGTDLFGKTLGVVGLGRIGSRVAYYAAKGFGMKVLYTDVKKDENFERGVGAQFFENIDDLLSRSDFISIHVPLLESTRHLINENKLKQMKTSAYLINTSRGPVIDEKALAKALKEKWIRGAAIDVFENEPKVEPELFRLNNIILTPHIASATEETRNAMAELAAKNIIEALEGRTPPNLVK
ncbi:MAG: D-glycerate dehydrogenase [Parcubacteria group bacterium RIFCSPLOWO2_01_FULL_40_65]|nr:MAG: D-glycerate dehydrogenase [Parcubacteria group bacterium RIFCSPHIGHO2_01_FULL_40_30]OHB22213.1 MAG: D-glycerate dehydrogenase [Parcubacteria group bacterium RIFCSPLOWO2_01_FULL_40_65]OHB23288.1 MAG: D-glycerate dehydrogenase [Parcubacteria group bacterium RIFCSPLOWO2_02_FULL_40_12]